MTGTITHEVAALRALRALADTGRNDTTPLRTQLRRTINFDQLIFPVGDESIDYAMRFLAAATRQVPAAFIPSMTSVKDLRQIDEEYTINNICRTAISIMACQMPPSATDRTLAARSLHNIATALIDADGNLSADIQYPIADLLLAEYTRTNLTSEADHVVCVERAALAGLTHVLDRKIYRNNILVDHIPATRIVGVLERAAASINTTWP